MSSSHYVLWRRLHLSDAVGGLLLWLFHFALILGVEK